MEKIIEMESYLTKGDPLSPTYSDIITQTALLVVGEPVPDGWRVLTGDRDHSIIARAVLRSELDE